MKERRFILKNSIDKQISADFVEWREICFSVWQQLSASNTRQP
jgi:hypothetical protein